MLPPEIQQRMQFHCSARACIRSPRAEGNAHIDGGCIQRVHGFLEVNTERFVGIERTRDADQHLSEIRINTPVAMLVRIGQRRSRHVSPNAEMIELTRHCPQARLYVSQTLPMGQLRKRHAEPLIPARESAQLPIGVVTGDTRLKGRVGEELHQLSEDCATLIHSSFSDAKIEIVLDRKRLQSIGIEIVAIGRIFLTGHMCG
jgi:hypothetical protein